MQNQHRMYPVTLHNALRHGTVANDKWYGSLIHSSSTSPSPSIRAYQRYGWGPLESDKKKPKKKKTFCVPIEMENHQLPHNPPAAKSQLKRKSPGESWGRSNRALEHPLAWVILLLASPLDPCPALAF